MQTRNKTMKNVIIHDDDLELTGQMPERVTLTVSEE